mmetsp:Transcript_22222/g.55738  ORF Transcript_22222/g.55738 Transcript_22222/m.55738 type:complete len:291 (+) Transcript_22222:715-1587(+)
MRVRALGCGNMVSGGCTSMCPAVRRSMSSRNPQRDASARRACGEGRSRKGSRVASEASTRAGAVCRWGSSAGWASHSSSMAQRRKGTMAFPNQSAATPHDANVGCRYVLEVRARLTSAWRAWKSARSPSSLGAPSCTLMLLSSCAQRPRYTSSRSCCAHCVSGLLVDARATTSRCSMSHRMNGAGEANASSPCRSSPARCSTFSSMRAVYPALLPAGRAGDAASCAADAAAWAMPALARRDLVVTTHSSPLLLPADTASKNWASSAESCRMCTCGGGGGTARCFMGLREK